MALGHIEAGLDYDLGPVRGKVSCSGAGTGRIPSGVHSMGQRTKEGIVEHGRLDITLRAATANAPDPEAGFRFLELERMKLVSSPARRTIRNNHAYDFPSL